MYLAEREVIFVLYLKTQLSSRYQPLVLAKSSSALLLRGSLGQGLHPTGFQSGALELLPLQLLPTGFQSAAGHSDWPCHPKHGASRLAFSSRLVFISRLGVLGYILLCHSRIRVFSRWIYIRWFPAECSFSIQYHFHEKNMPKRNHIERSNTWRMF